MVYGSLVDVVSDGRLPGALRLRSAPDVTFVITVYGAGFAVLSAAMLGLYLAASRAADALGLDAYERAYTRVGTAIWSLLLFVGAGSALAALLLPPRYGVWSAMAYSFMGPAVPLVVAYMRKGVGEAPPP